MLVKGYKVTRQLDSMNKLWRSIVQDGHYN